MVLLALQLQTYCSLRVLRDGQLRLEVDTNRVAVAGLEALAADGDDRAALERASPPVAQPTDKSTEQASFESRSLLSSYRFQCSHPHIPR